MDTVVCFGVARINNSPILPWNMIVAVSSQKKASSKNKKILEGQNLGESSCMEISYLKTYQQHCLKSTDCG